MQLKLSSVLRPVVFWPGAEAGAARLFLQRRRRAGPRDESGLQLLNTVVTYAPEGDIRGKLRARPKGPAEGVRARQGRPEGRRVGHRPIRYIVVYWTTMPTMGAGDQGPIPQRKPERQLSWPRLAAGTKTIQ